jgi:uncharacterized protein YkwD
MFRPGPIARSLSALYLLLWFAAPSESQETGNLRELRERALELVNEARRDQGLEPLSPGAMLDAAAQSHAEDMLRRDYYAHVSPEGETIAERYAEAGGSRWRLTAENIARCRGCPSPPTEDRVESLHQGWMNSPPHRENILRRGLDRFGFGLVVGDDRTLYAVQTFAGAGQPRDAQPGEEIATLAPERQTDIAVQRINRARSERNLEPLSADPTLIRAASNLVPDGDLAASAQNLQENLAKALPQGRGDWASLAALVGQCGGCGEQPVAADVRFFVEQWLKNDTHRDRLLSSDLTGLGLVVKANGEGLKVGAAVLGERR